MSEFEKYRATLPLHQMLVSANCCKHAFEYQQAIINDLKAQLECCRRENAVLLGKVGELQGKIDETITQVNKYRNIGLPMLNPLLDDIEKALRGAND